MQHWAQACLTGAGLSQRNSPTAEKPSASATLIGLAGREGCRFLTAQDTREAVDARVLGGAMARGGHIGNEQERRGQDTKKNIPQPDAGRELAVTDPENSGVVAQDHAVDVCCQRKVVGMRAADLALACADGLQELPAMSGGTNRVSSPEATKRMRVASADYPNCAPTPPESLHQMGG